MKQSTARTTKCQFGAQRLGGGRDRKDESGASPEWFEEVPRFAAAWTAIILPTGLSA